MTRCLICEDEGWVCETHPDQPFAEPHARVAVVPGCPARNAILRLDGMIRQGFQGASRRTPNRNSLLERAAQTDDPRRASELVKQAADIVAFAAEFERVPSPSCAVRRP
jgi:hypothetical protein